MRLHRAEGFLYTKRPVLRLAPAMVARAPINEDAEMFGYAYTSRRLPRPTLTTMTRGAGLKAAGLKAAGLKLVFGYAYTARYDRVQDDRIQDDRMAA
jgi:hypothetical protein